MVRSYVRLLQLALIGSAFVPVVIMGSLIPGSGVELAASVFVFVLAAVAALGSVLLCPLLQGLQPVLETEANRQAEFLDALNPLYLDLAIAGAAALSLFLELSMIRWQGTVFEFFAFYKNFGLLACFVGLGLGCALSGRGSIPLLLCIPVMAWQFAFMIVLRFGGGGALLAGIRAIPLR